VWYKDAVPISPVKTPRYRVLVGGSLQINGLLPDDTGMFQCFARNQAGEVQTNTYLAVTSEFIHTDYTSPLYASHTLMHKYMWTFSSSASLCLSLSLAIRKALNAIPTMLFFLPGFILSCAADVLFCRCVKAVINTLL